MRDDGGEEKGDACLPEPVLFDVVGFEADLWRNADFRYSTYNAGIDRISIWVRTFGNTQPGCVGALWAGN